MRDLRNELEGEDGPGKKVIQEAAGTGLVLDALSLWKVPSFPPLYLPFRLFPASLQDSQVKSVGQNLGLRTFIFKRVKDGGAGGWGRGRQCTDN